MEITKYKSKLDISYALGTTVCFELLTNKPKQVVKLFIHPKLNRDETYTKILNLAIKNNIEVIESIKPFNILADKDNCFVIAEFKKYDMKINNNNNHVLLVNPSNTGNLGTIIRTMLGFNITDLAIIVPTVDIFDPKTIRSSMGAIFSLNIQLFNSYDEYIKNNSDKHIFPFMLKAKKAIKNISVPNK
jgi:TrmH family RNA methyltransferase